MSETKVYVDWLSQPSRAVVIYCELEQIPIEIIEVKIKDMDLRKPEFREISATQKVPALSDKPTGASTSFNLFESHAMVRFLADRYNKSLVYPRGDIRLKASIEQYLDWHHTNTRKCSQYIFNLLFTPIIGFSFNIDMTKALPEIESALKFISSHFLAGGANKFIGNNVQLTFADVSCYSELAQMKLINYDFAAKFPLVHKWMLMMEDIPAIKNAHQTLHKVINKMNAKKPKL